MANVQVTEQVHRVIVEDDRVRVVTAGVPGPQGPKGDPGDLDTDELEQIVDGAVSVHAAHTQDVHGIPDTTQLATQADLDNLEVLPDGGTDGEVLTLADGSPTWAAPEGGGLDPEGDETITGEWEFTSGKLGLANTSNFNNAGMVIGSRNTEPSLRSILIGYQIHEASDSVRIGHSSVGANGGSYSTTVGQDAGALNTTSGKVLFGRRAGRQASGLSQLCVGQSAGERQSGDYPVFIGQNAGRDNDRDHRLIIDSAPGNDGNLVDPLIDGRFRSGTDPDDFEYSKGVKVNGHLEATDQLILRSPDGTRWAITVDDEGNLSTQPATEAITP